MYIPYKNINGIIKCLLTFCTQQYFENIFISVYMHLSLKMFTQYSILDIRVSSLMNKFYNEDFLVYILTYVHIFDHTLSIGKILSNF